MLTAIFSQFSPFYLLETTKREHMKEDFLHYIWQYQYFDKSDLKTDEGEVLHIFHPGHAHVNAGPDFGYARLKLGEIAWVGQVEIHIKASDWYKHGHQHDDLYDAVILHVVWENDQAVCRQDGSQIPCFSLRERVGASLQERYQKMVMAGSGARNAILCATWLPQLSPILKFAALDRALFQRLERRSLEWLLLLEEKNGDWEQVAYQQLAHYLGGVINAQPFVQLTHQVSWRELQREYSQQEQIMARLFGYAGFLGGEPADAYQARLQKVFDWQQQNEHDPPIFPIWKWSRMRPSSFPVARLAQLASMACTHPHLLDVLQVSSVKSLKEWLHVPRPIYWQKHYHFGKATKKPSDQWPIDMLMINWFVPLCYAYGKYRGLEQYQERAIAILQQLPAEQNKKLLEYKHEGFSFSTAADTQGALELHKHHCEQANCLSCPIGVKVLSL